MIKALPKLIVTSLIILLKSFLCVHHYSNLDKTKQLMAKYIPKNVYKRAEALRTDPLMVRFIWRGTPCGWKLIIPMGHAIRFPILQSLPIYHHHFPTHHKPLNKEITQSRGIEFDALFMFLVSWVPNKRGFKQFLACLSYS